MAKEKLVIGLDGGGAKTVAALADLKERILAQARTGSSSPRNIGLEKAMENVARVISQVLKKRKGKIVSTFLGLPCLEEEFKFKKDLIKKELLKHKEIWPIFKGRLIIGSDQLVGFRAGTREKEGIVLISGSGAVCHGWARGKESKIDGWGYLSEMGGAFFVGQRVIQEIFKDLDKRRRTLLRKIAFEKLKIKKRKDLISLIYSKKPMEVVPQFSIFADLASQKGDLVAKEILKEAAEELSLSARSVIKELNFQNRKFPLVLIGGMFKSKFLLTELKKEIKKFAPKVNFIRPRVEPVIGAVRLALENLSH